MRLLFLLISTHYATPYDYVWRGILLLVASEYDTAADQFELVLTKLPNDLSSHHHLAAIRSSCAESTIRNGAMAMEHARTVAVLRATPTWRSLSILAACHAECGDFDSAQRFGKTALRLSPNDYRSRLECRLVGYQNGEPY